MSYNYTSNKAWRKRHPIKWQKGKQRYYKQFEADAYNGNQIWTTSNINFILQKNIPDRDIAKQIGRSVKAIQIKRVRLNKIGKKNFKNIKTLV